MKTKERITGRMYALSAAIFAGGILVGKFLMGHDDEFVYKTSRMVALVDTEGRDTGRLPLGTSIVSALKADPGGELGWWGFVPVYFGTSSEAAKLLQLTNIHAGSIHEQITLNGLPPEEIPEQ